MSSCVFSLASVLVPGRSALRFAQLWLSELLGPALPRPVRFSFVCREGTAMESFLIHLTLQGLVVAALALVLKAINSTPEHWPEHFLDMYIFEERQFYWCCCCLSLQTFLKKRESPFNFSIPWENPVRHSFPRRSSWCDLGLQ